MGRIVVTKYVSVDGAVEAPSGTETFERVGWTDAFYARAGRRSVQAGRDEGIRRAAARPVIYEKVA